MRNILLVLVLILVFISKITIGQEFIKPEKVKEIESKYTKYFEYTDPYFPEFIESESEGGSLSSYKRTLEEYAKIHRPVPEQPITGTPADNEADYKILLDNWYSANPHFPRLIQYHLFHKNMTIENDILFYEKAIKVWLGRNPKINVKK